jgi:opacity protein-like surface antigen
MKIFLFAAVIILVCMPAFSSDEVYRDAGAGAFSFLKIDPGARAAALGGTGLLNSGILAGFTNPALLASMETGSISAGHNQWLGDATQNFLSWNFSLDRVKCSIGTRFVYVGNLQMRESASSEPITTFSSWDISLHASAGIRLGIFDLGLGLKLIREKIWMESTSGIAFDAGVVVHPLTDLEFAGAIQNIGPSITMVDDDFRLPTTWRLGSRFGFDLPLGYAALTVEAGKPLDNTLYTGSGIEYTPVEWIALRFGMRFLDDSRDFTSGIGLSTGSWTLDYAFIPTDYSLGSVHRFTLHKSL